MKNIYEKVTHIFLQNSHSPPTLLVWLQLVPTSHGTFQIRGGHDIDAGWLRDVRANSTIVKVVPRLIFEQWSIGHLRQVRISQNSEDPLDRSEQGNHDA